MKRREAWFDSQLDLDPEKLVFIDETWASTNIARKNGCAPRGERLRAAMLPRMGEVAGSPTPATEAP